MKKKIMKLFASAVFSLGLTAVHADAAPAFTLPDGHGNEHSLSDFEGKIVVLEWVNQECPFVVKFYSGGHMQALQAEMAEKGVIWLSINSSAPGLQGWLSPEDHLSTIEEKGINAHAVLIDEDGTVGRAFGARTTPHMFVIDKEGNIAYQGAIDSVRSTNPADIPEARNYVREAVTALLAGEAPPVARTQPYGCSVKYN
jgi:peroxiredoxin